MTVRAEAVEPTAGEPTAGPGPSSTLLLGYPTVFRKEVAEWVRGRRALVVGIVSVALATLTTAMSFIVGEAPPGVPPLSMDPTVNVLSGWQGLTFQIVALLATIGLVTVERDRGTLAWSLSQPVSPACIIAAKWSAALVVYGAVGVVLPLVISSVVATLAYGSPPDLATVASFAALYMLVPAFYFGLTIALGIMVNSSAAVAGVSFAVMLVPSAIGALLPIVNEVSPTSIAGWATSMVTGGSASPLTLLGWAAAMCMLAVGAKVTFDRQEH